MKCRKMLVSLGVFLLALAGNFCAAGSGCEDAPSAVGGAAGVG